MALPRPLAGCWALISTACLVPERTRCIARARQAIFHVAIHQTRATAYDISQAMKRDHSTVLHGINVVDELLWKRDPEFCEMYQKIARLVA
jgi:chromosomal replication initiation ATPase DnaA